jgi:hypothetical protein
MDGGIDYLESILGLLKRLQIGALSGHVGEKELGLNIEG